MHSYFLTANENYGRMEQVRWLDEREAVDGGRWAVDERISNKFEIENSVLIMMIC